MGFIKKNLLAIIVAGAGVIALILGIALEPVAELGEEVKLFDVIKRIVKVPIKIVVKVCGFACKILTKINKNIERKVLL